MGQHCGRDWVLAAQFGADLGIQQPCEHHLRLELRCQLATVCHVALPPWPYCTAVPWRANSKSVHIALSKTSAPWAIFRAGEVIYSETP
jgi:hypothetical protein